MKKFINKHEDSVCCVAIAVSGGALVILYVMTLFLALNTGFLGIS